MRGEYVHDVVTLSHGGGGRDTWKIINDLIVSKVPSGFRRVLDGVGLSELDDGVAFRLGDQYVVVSIDSYTVKPSVFPGGDLGALAASGTINDLVMMGAKPLGVVDAILVEEGTPIGFLDMLVNSMVSVLLSEGVALLGGDFKVMPKGSLDGIVITTAGFGLARKLIVDTEIRVGDKIVVTGPIAEHGAVIIAAQLGLLENAKDLRSDVRPLAKYLLPVVDSHCEYIHAARDPTRGGLAATLSEWVAGRDLTVVIDRSKIPIREPVKEFLDMLGIDPLNVASEGVAALAVDPLKVDEIVDRLRKLGLRDATLVGEVVKPPSKLASGRVLARTEVGGLTLVEVNPSPVPRIC